MRAGTTIEWTHVPGYRPATWSPITITEGSWPRLVDFHEGRLDEPLNQEEPSCYVVENVFDKTVPLKIIGRIFAVMALCPQHLFIVVRKTARMMKVFCTYQMSVDRIYDEVCDRTVTEDLPVILEAPGIPIIKGLNEFRRVKLGQWPLPNFWFGIPAEDQPTADERIPDLLATPAAKRIVSVEPMLGPVDLSPWINRLDWVICGGESGPGARPMHPDWARSLRDQCVGAGVPFFMKQWGEFLHWSIADGDLRQSKAPIILAVNEKTGRRNTYFKVGKKRAGHMLDGVEWRQFPEEACK